MSRNTIQKQRWLTKLQAVGQQMVTFWHTWLDVIGACLRKEIISALSEKVALFQMVILPLNYNILLILFALAGSAALADHGPDAQQFYEALMAAHSYRLQVVPSLATANALLKQGNIVAVVTIPSDFDTKVQQRQHTQIGLLVNNLDADFTDDVARGLRLAITVFSQHAFPGQVSITPQIYDAYPRQTDYIPYLSVAVVIIGILVGGLLQAGNAMARDWEDHTVKELLLSPAPRSAIIIGKMLAAGLVSLLSAVAVILFLVGVIHVTPLNWGGFLGTLLLMSGVSVAAGTLLGNLLKQQQAVTLLMRGSSVPLFLLSGVFNPITYSTLGIILLARLFPIHYGISLVQRFALGHTTNSLSTGENVGMLVGFLLLFLLGSTFLLSRAHIIH